MEKTTATIIIAMVFLIFEIGKFYGENKVHIKKEYKRARRDAIIRMKWRISNMMMYWKHYHSEKPLMLNERKGSIIYKHGGEVYTEQEFQEKLERVRAK